MVHVLFVLSVFLEKTIWWKEWIELKGIWHLAHLNFKVTFCKNSSFLAKKGWELTKLKGRAAASLIPTTSIGLSVSLSIFLLSLKLIFTKVSEIFRNFRIFRFSYNSKFSKNSPGFIAAAWVSVSFSWSRLNFIFEIQIWFLFDFWKTGNLLNRCLLMSLSCCWYLKQEN